MAMMVLSRKITSSFQKFKRHLQNPLRLDRPEPFFDGAVFLQRSSDRRTGNGVCERICDEDIGTGVSDVKRFLSIEKARNEQYTAFLAFLISSPAKSRYTKQKEPDASGSFKVLSEDGHRNS